jgi:hypothetical protein
MLARAVVLPVLIDFVGNRKGFLMAYPGTRASLSLGSDDELVKIGTRTSARFQVWRRATSGK